VFPIPINCVEPLTKKDLSQAKEHDIFDTSPFLHSRLFSANGYTLNNNAIEKKFRRAND